MRLHCYTCQKSVTTEVSDKTVVRAALFCPECIESDTLKILMGAGDLTVENRELRELLAVCVPVIEHGGRTDAVHYLLIAIRKALAKGGGQ